MRTADPTIVRQDFERALQDLGGALADAETQGLTAISMKLVTEMSLLSAATLWEGFLSDLVVAYINKDPANFNSRLVASFEIQAKGEFARAARPQMTLRVDKHLNTEEIRAILDPRQYNVTFKDIADLKARAGQWLVPTSSAPFHAITASQGAALEGWVSMRNFLAHRSASARSRMNAALQAPVLGAGLRRGSNAVHDVGKFLRATYQGTRRIDLYIHEMKALAVQLCP